MSKFSEWTLAALNVVSRTARVAGPVIGGIIGAALPWVLTYTAPAGSEASLATSCAAAAAGTAAFSVASGGLGTFFGAIGGYEIAVQAGISADRLKSRTNPQLG